MLPARQCDARSCIKPLVASRCVGIGRFWWCVDQFYYPELTSSEAWLTVRFRELVFKMKKLFRIFAIGCLGIMFLGASSQMASASCSSKPNIFGGSDTRCTDGSKSSTRPNIFGGYDTYDGSGRKISSSKPNIFGGTDTKNSNSSNTTKTKPNIFGGKDMTGSNGTKIGSTKPNIFGGYDVFDKNGRKLQSCKPNIFGGYDCR